MPKIVKLSDLSKKERKKVLEQTQKEVEERKAKIESEISFTSKNKSNNNIQLPIAKKTDNRIEKYTSSFPTSNNVNRNNVGNKQKEESKETFRKLNPNKKLTYTKTTNTLPTKEKIIEITSNIAKNKAKNTTNVLGNVGYGLANGLISLQQQFNRVTKKGINDRLGVGDNINSKLNLPTSQDMLKNMLGEDSDKPITNIGEKLEKQKQTNTENIQRNIDNSNNIVTKKLAEVAPSIGQMIPGMLPGIGATYFAGSASGNYYDEAKQRGMSEKEAERYSAIMGLAEGGAEALGGKITKSIGKNLIKGNAKQALKMFGLDVLENFAEEAIMEPLSEATATVTAGKDKADWNNIGKRMLQSGLDGAIVATIMGGASAGVGSSINIVNKIAKGEKVTSNDINTAKNDIQNNISADVQKKIKEAETIVNNIDNQTNQSTQQVQEPNKIIQNINQPNNITKANTVNLPVQRYQYQKSYNIKIDNLRQDASRYFNNSEKANNYVKMLEKIIEDKDIDIRLDGNLKTADGRIANGSYANGVITINPNSTRAGEFIAIHELTHAIGTDQMKKMIQTYRDSNSEFNGAVEKLLENYNISEINEEALSDISGQLFGNQEFINNLAQNNPNLFQRIYNEIKYLWHQFVGYRNQDQFINDLRYKWEQAYRNNSGNTNNQTQYSIAGRKAIENIKYSDPKQYDEAMNAYNKARRMAKKGIDNKKIIKATNWFKDKKGKWKFEFSDKDMQLKPYVFKKNFEYDLGDILEHDTLFKYYPELKGYKVIFTDLKGINGSHLRGKEIIKLDENKFDSRLAEEGTLIHEIQHAIQGIEGFSKGTTAKYGLLPYYRNLGEIEASDTKERMLKEKQGIKLREAPESSKKHPVHPDLKGMNAVDKARFYIYNSIRDMAKRGGKYSEEVHSIDKEEVANHVRQNTNMVVGRERITNTENSRKSSFSMPKVQKGYTRLYRGLENEYDSNYDKTKLDNSNGYESWTDNYELAKAYGDNVYYIDVPTTEIKNSVIDEDSNSETYGDRNLLYKNDKAVGIKGKSGNEYMLYTDHDNYENIKYNKIDANMSVQDNQGRTLTKEQQEYFKDSKVRDENGNLLTMYHGTPNGDHTIFKDGTYFTPRKEYADGYQNTWASAISTKTNASNPKTYEVYLNITNPFTLQNPKAKEIYLNEFIKGGNSLSYDPYTDWTNDINNLEEIDWTEAEDLREWLVENHPEYDGLVLDEGGDGGYGEAEYRWRGKSFVPFNSNQIKNIDNTNPTADKDIRYALPTKDWEHYLDDNYKPTGTRTNLKEIRSSNKSSFIMPTPEKTMQDVGAPINNTNKNTEMLTDKDYEVLNKIYEKEGRTEVLTEKRKASLLEKYASDKYKFKDSMNLLSQKFINKGHYIDKLSEQAKNPELKFIYDKNLNSFAEGQYSIGVAQTDNNGNEIGKSINEIWKPVEDSNLTKEFSEYLLHKHNIDRSGRNKYVFGEGIGPTESTAIALDLEQKHPEFKQYAEDIKKFNHNNLENMKKAGLITQEAIDYMESMYPNYIPISRDIENSIYTGNNEKTGANAPIKKATGGNSDIQPIKDSMAQQVIRIKRLVNQNNLGKELAKTLKNAKVEEGIDIELTPSLLFDIETMVETDSEGNKYYTYFESGKQQKLKINDNLYESLRPTEINRLEKTLPVKALQKITNVHRSLLTSSNPLFVVTNFFKDFQDGAFNSKYSRKFIKNYGKALSEIVTKGKYYQSYMANGGMTNTYFDYNEGIKKKGNKFVNKIRSINEIVEQLPRLSEFISTLEDGKSLNEALYNAAEITTNFKRGGDITKAINRNGVNFLNASIQGLDKQYRNLKGQNGVKGYVNLLAKATIMSIAPSILNHMLLDDDEDYQDLPQSTKDLYYLFKYDDGKFIRIPKGRVLSIFGAAARRVIETVQGQEDSWQGFGDTIINQVAPNNPLEDNILSPMTQVKNNKTWYGTDLVSSRLQQELPKNQYDETTDELSKWIGNKINVSPKKINYLLDQYSGALGDILLPIITPQAKQNVVVDKFTTDSVLKNKNVSAFYETLEKQTQIANDSFATDEDEIQLKYLNSISKSMSDLYKEKREVQMSKISNKEKTKKVREIQEQINQLAEEGLNNYKNTTQGKSFSKVGNEEYYKSSSGEWTKLSEEEKEKMGDISIEVYSDYKQKVYEMKDKKVSNGELKKSQDLKDKDKIQILLNSKYTDKQITQIYETYIRNQNEKEYTTMSKTGINIKEYLKYKQQDFESDKKDDGTTKGKSISGSKKKKVYNYVNNMDIDYEQRLLLLGMQYSLKDSEKTKLANYINNLDITKKEKMEIYEQVSGFKVYKNGTIKW